MVLQEKGFSLIPATHGSQGLRLLMSKTIDAVILEYHMGLLDGAAVAGEIKKVRPRLPIVMLTKSLELPEGALKSVDALVTKCDGPRFLLEAIHTARANLFLGSTRPHCRLTASNASSVVIQDPQDIAFLSSPRGVLRPGPPLLCARRRNQVSDFGISAYRKATRSLV